jgi:hypothetical protein
MAHVVHLVNRDYEAMCKVRREALRCGRRWACGEEGCH